MIPIEEKDQKPVEVYLEQSLLFVANVNYEVDVIDIIVKQWYTWRNKALAWDPKNPNTSINNVTLPLRYLWSPDITASSAVHAPEVLSPELAIVSSDGEVLYEVQKRLSLHTDLSSWESTGSANVSFTYESWTYDDSKLRLFSHEYAGFTSEEFESRHYYVSNTTVSKQTNKYPPSQYEFDVLHFSFNLEKKR